MPISSDNTRLSIDFIYEYQTPDGMVLQYQMRFQHTEVGPIVSVTQAPYEGVELPADMFGEVAQFLNSQGAMRSFAPVAKIGNASASTLGLPQIGRKNTTKQVPASTLVEETKEELSDEEAEALRNERLSAAAKAKKAQKPFHSNHKKKEQ